MACPHATAHSWSSSFSRDSWEAIIDSSAHKVTELSRCLPLSPPSMCPNFPVLLCVWMSGKAQIRHRNSCSGGLLACIHTSTHARIQKSVREAAAGTHPPKKAEYAHRCAPLHKAAQTTDPTIHAPHRAIVLVH